MTKILKKYPILCFITIVFILSYGLGIPFNMWVSENTNLPEPFDIYLPRLLTVISPGISALILMLSSKSRIGLKFFLPKSEKKFIYFFIPVLTLMISVISLLIGGTSVDLIATILLKNWDQLFFHLVLQIAIIGIGEEIGWRSWLLPILNKRKSLIKSMLIVLVIWILWHFPILFQKVEILIPWLCIIFSATIILTWAWKNYGNTPILFGVIHGSINYPQFFWENQKSLIDPQVILNGWTISSYIYLAISFMFFISLSKMVRTKYKLRTKYNNL